LVVLSVVGLLADATPALTTSWLSLLTATAEWQDHVILLHYLRKGDVAGNVPGVGDVALLVREAPLIKVAGR
jgi:hypothetical protein